MSQLQLQMSFETFHAGFFIDFTCSKLAGKVTNGDVTVGMLQRPQLCTPIASPFPSMLLQFRMVAEYVDVSQGC